MLKFSFFDKIGEKTEKTDLYVSKIISFAFIAKILYHIEGRNAIHFLRSTYKYITRSIYAYTNI